MSLLITESEKRRILGLHEKVKSDNYVFDFVLTENHKYLIYMDNVFVRGGNGKSIGSIWENTHIFNEILNESLKKKNILSEEIETTINNFQWSKETVEGWLSDKTELSENWLTDQWDNTWNNLKDGKEASSALFKGEILPFLRWVRKMSMTNMGIVLDIVGTFFLAKSTMVVWGMIVLLDIYEIATNNIGDDRKDSPYLGLMCDVAGLVLIGAAAKGLKVASKNIATQGIKNPSIIKTLKTLLSKIPGVKSMLDKVGAMLIKVFPKGGMVQKMLGYSTNVLKKLSAFIDGLLKKNGQKVGKKVVTQSAVGVGLNTALGGASKTTRSYETDKALIKKVFALNESTTDINEQLRKKIVQGVGDAWNDVVKGGSNRFKNSTDQVVALANSQFKKDLSNFLTKSVTKKWYQVFKKNPTNLDEFIKATLSDKKMTEHIADMINAVGRDVAKVRSGDVKDVRMLNDKHMKQVKNEVTRQLGDMLDKTLKKGVKKKSLNNDQQQLIKQWQSELPKYIANKKLKIPNFDKAVKESMTGSRIRFNQLHKDLNNPKVIKTIDPITKQVTALKKGVSIFKIICNLKKLKMLGLLGLTGYGIYQMYQMYNDFIIPTGESTQVVLVDENGNAIDPENLEGSASGNEGVENLPTELQNMITNDGAEYITSPQEGVFIKNDDYPEGIYLFSNGVAQDLSTGDEGTWTP